MADDPFSRIPDAPLFIVPRVLDALAAWRAGPKLADLPGPSPSAERERLVAALEDLGTRLLEGIAAHPTRFWAMGQIRQTLDAVHGEDVRAREFFGEEIERVLDILGIEDSGGLVAYHLGR